MHLPLIWEAAIERLYGLRGRASVYRCLARLRTMGLIDELRPALRSRRNPGLLYLTDFGIATVAADQQVDPIALARRARLRGSDLTDRLRGLPQLLALYELLVSVAASHKGRIDLLAWEQPWRRTFSRPTRRSLTTVKMPAHAVLSWDDRAAAFLLLPDLATSPLDVHRQALAHLLVLRHQATDPMPTLVVATTEARKHPWSRLLSDVARARSEAPLAARVVTLARAPRRRFAHESDRRAIAELIRNQPRHAPAGARDGATTPRQPDPRPVGPDFAARAPTVSRLLALKGMDRDLLDLIGRHPFLSSAGLATVLGWEVGRLRERLARTIGLGFARLVEPREIRASAHTELIELTVDGVELVAAQQGLSVVKAVRYNGLAGGGPRQEIGTRRLLLKNILHTRGADAVFVELYRRLGVANAAAGGDAVLEWRNAAACGRRRARPDGYGMIRHRGQAYGFFLEFDRGTMSARDYGGKWSGYYHYLRESSLRARLRRFPDHPGRDD